LNLGQGLSPRKGEEIQYNPVGISDMAATVVPGTTCLDGQWVGLARKIPTNTQIGLPALFSQCPFSTAKSGGGKVVRMAAVSVEQKKYTTQKSQEIFTAAKVVPSPLLTYTH
jgi:hypothetical protein